ncbi:MAG: KH domain-containing protein, partial [Clostridium sp.]
QGLKKIGETARYEIEKFLNAKVNLKVWVKVRKEWRDNQNLLKELGYKKTK